VWDSGEEERPWCDSVGEGTAAIGYNGEERERERKRERERETSPPP